MGHDGGQLGQGLVAPERLGQGEDLHGGEESPALLDASLQVEGDHPAHPLALLGVDLVLGVGRQGRVEDPFHTGIRLQELRHGQGILVVGTHPKVEGLEATVDKEAVEGRRHGADG